MNFDFQAALGFGTSGLLGGFAFPTFAQVAPPTLPGLESFGANGAVIGILVYLVIQLSRERVAEAVKFAERTKEQGAQAQQTIDNYQQTTADLINRVLVHYERQLPIPAEEE
jgi:hypothetical protein